MSIKADATLVNAAYRMGMASVPPDTSRIFQNQFRALRDMHRSAVEGMKSVIEAGTTMLEKKGQADEFQRSYDQLSKDFLKNSGEFISRHYKNGKGPDKDTVEYAKVELVDIKVQIETLRNMPGTRTPEQNEQLKAMEKNVATWREENNKTLGLLTAHGDMHASDLVDDNQSFMITDPVTGEQKVDSNMRGLYTQIIHPGITLSSVGIKLGRNEKGQRGYYYDASVNRTLQTAEITSPDGDGTSQTKIKPGSMKFISEEELFGMVVQKDLAVVNNIADRISEGFMSSDLSRETKSFVKDPKTGRLVQSKTIEPEVKTYDDITLKGKEDFYNIITATHNVDENGVRTKRDIRAGLHYLQNNPIQVGTAMLNYNEDSKSNPNINTLTYSQLGLSGKGIDKNNDGRLSGDELTEEDRDIIHQRLMNPRTPEEIEIASRELADYFDRQTRDQFNKRRGDVPEATNVPNWKIPGTAEWKRVQDVSRVANKPTYKNVKLDFELLMGYDKEGKREELTKTDSDELINIDNKLNKLMNKGTYLSGDYVDVFGNKIGYFPGKGFAPVRQATRNDVGNKKFEKEIGRPIKVGEMIIKLPGSDVAYWKTPQDVFQHYQIPTTYSKEVYKKGDEMPMKDGRTAVYNGTNWVVKNK